MIENVKNTLKKLNNSMKDSGLSGTITYRSEASHMVRCGRSQISLNVSEAGEKFFIDLQEGKKKISGSISASMDDFTKVDSYIKELGKKITFMPEVDHLKPLEAIAQGDLDKHKVDEKIANIDSDIMVSLFKNIDSEFSDKNVEISGAFSAGVYSYALINTLVDEALYYQGTDFNVEAVLQLLDHDKKEVRAALVGEGLEHYSESEIINELKTMFNIKTSTAREDLKAGDYDVVFTADAFAELTSYMGYLTLDGETYEYGMGMLQKDKHEIGSKIFGDNVTIVDNPNDPDILFARGFGLNGVERKSFPLISSGVLDNLFYSDKDTCDRFSVSVNNDRKVASLKVETGEGPKTFDEMIASCERPTIFIPFIHYMNFTNPAKGEFTGTSRFGTFLVEGGKVKSHLYNLRINDSYHHIFNNIDWLSSTLAHINTSNTYGLRNASSVACPKFVKVNGVSITGSSAPKN